MFVTRVATFGHCTNRKRKSVLETKKEEAGTGREEKKETLQPTGSLPRVCWYSSSNPCVQPSVFHEILEHLFLINSSFTFKPLWETLVPYNQMTFEWGWWFQKKCKREYHPGEAGRPSFLEDAVAFAGFSFLMMSQLYNLELSNSQTACAE